jgi:hypothetical protein
MLNNIGLPYSGINIALSDSATVEPIDGEIHRLKNFTFGSVSVRAF